MKPRKVHKWQSELHCLLLPNSPCVRQFRPVLWNLCLPGKNREMGSEWMADKGRCCWQTEEKRDSLTLKPFCPLSPCREQTVNPRISGVTSNWHSASQWRWKRVGTPPSLLWHHGLPENRKTCQHFQLNRQKNKKQKRKWFQVYWCGQNVQQRHSVINT